MHTHSIDRWQHDHVFLGEKHELYERRTWLVVALTVATMVAEIAGGTIYHSMALVADGWHMSTHAGALAIAALAYRFARRHDRDARFSFGTGKLGELAAFASAVILGLIALLIAYESPQRLFSPVTIQFEQAILIAIIGLAVNLGSAWLLYDKQHYDDHSHPHGDASDHNIRAAYLHVLADATTSVLAIVALVAGSIWGWVWLDPMMGLIGALLITHWSIGMMRVRGRHIARHGARPGARSTDPRKARTEGRSRERPPYLASRAGSHRSGGGDRVRPPATARRLQSPAGGDQRPFAHHHRGASMRRH